ncbi:hypothetical protein PHAVU_004G166900 [Phaseolus vulgaris]
MANTPTSGLRLLGIGNYSNTIKLGNAATISVKTAVNENIFSRKETWELSYLANRITSTLFIDKTTTKKISDEEKISISIRDFLPKGNLHYSTRAEAGFPPSIESFFITVEKDEAGFLKLFSSHYSGTDEDFRSRRSRERNTTGTTCDAYGSGTRIGLLVMERKKRSNEERPYMLTVAHYYVNNVSGGGYSGASDGVDLGFSVVVKIGVHNGVLGFSVDGPVEHPTYALLYMIEQVSRTGMWKLSACPHCKNIQWQQQQRRWLSESEDSDAIPPTPSSHGTQRNVTNKGEFNGDANGGIIQAKYVNFNKYSRTIL